MSSKSSGEVFNRLRPVILGKPFVGSHLHQFWEPLLSGHQVTDRSSQGSVLSLGMSGKSKGLFFRVLQDKGWLEIPDKSLSSNVEEPSSESVFFKRENPQIARCNA